MDRKRHIPSQTRAASAVRAVSWLGDLARLIKFRLTLLVVLSAVLGYLIASGGTANVVPVIVLAVAGLCVAGAANAVNQVLEKDYDAMMTRTADRPVAAGRMQGSDGVFIAGFLLLTGEILLALYNPLTAFLGMLSFTIYAFLYTPMKRYGTLSVAVGGIPGALPVVIGCTAFEGTITWLAVILFAIQFLWQFPHFWAIGYLSFDQYKKAGFRLVPMSADGTIARNLGFHTFIYTVLLVPVSTLTYTTGVAGIFTTGILVLLSAWYAYKALKFWKAFDHGTARSLMFASFAYLPLALIVILIGIFI